jgi:hypothetical protein
MIDRQSDTNHAEQHDMATTPDGSVMTPDQALDALMEGNRRYLDTTVAPID